ncbi:MAG: response regulator [Candidatus Bathyarchaeota archaeon]|nr:response regulator [Candidatus Bathyarchaeota archaeon]
MGKKILIVDSDTRTSKSFSDVFIKEGFQVSIAHYPLQAQELLQHNSYDCVLMSFSHPATIGRDLLVFSQQSLPNALTIVLNDFPTVESAIEAIECGSDAMFAKPVNLKLLLKVIREKTACTQPPS